MMPPEQARARIVSEWLRKADADMGLAEHLLSEKAPFYNAIAFNCQQAAEKFIKAFLVWAQVDFPKTHDLTELLALAAPINDYLAAQLREATALTPYGVELRYPGDRPDASPAEAREAVRLARKVRDAVLPLLSRPTPEGGQ